MSAQSKTEMKKNVLKAELSKLSKEIESLKNDLEASKKAFLNAIKELNSPANLN